MSIELSAIKTLDKLGYTYHGGELWKSPIGEKPIFANKRFIDRDKEKEERLQEVSECFDFERVHRVMKFLDWTWVSSDFKVPSVAHIRSIILLQVSQLYTSTLKHMKPQSYSCGGFDISTIIEDDDTISISVKFVLTEWDSFTPE